MDRAAGPSGVTIRFYRREGDAPVAEASGLAPAWEIRSWRPARDGAPPDGPHTMQNLVWFAFDRLGLFSSHDFEELSVWRGGRMLHRLIVSPRWFRFPFMAAGDLQIGALWTDSGVRRLGLARAAIAEAHRRHAAPGRAFWYVTDAGNAPSVALAEACGYRLAGEGRRTRPLGLPLFGQYRLEWPTAPPGC
jgi:hypothetical protein